MTNNFKCHLDYLLTLKVIRKFLKMDVFSVEEKVQIVKWYVLGHPSREITDLFVVAFENQPPPSRTTIRRIVRNFEQTGCVSPKKHKLMREKTEEEINKEINVCALFEEDPYRTLRQVSNEMGLGKDDIRKILKAHGYKSFKVRKTQELLAQDNFSRMEFCENVMELCNQDANFIENILFTDESTFPINGRHNPSVTRCWSRVNPRDHYNYRTQYPRKLNVWAGIVGNSIIGPFFINGTLNGARYLDLLQNQIVPALQERGINLEITWFQQDGCPAHQTAAVHEFMQTIFLDRIISRRGIIGWPPRSPDLSMNDFFLWGYIKSLIYRREEVRPHTLDDLRNKIIEACATITPQMLINARRSFYDRLGYCLAQEGGVFEHLL